MVYIEKEVDEGDLMVLIIQAVGGGALTGMVKAIKKAIGK